MDEVRCVSAETALHLLHKFFKDSSRASLNISSTVSAVSEVIRIKTDRLLLIKLAPGLDIIVKNIEKLEWTLLVPQETYTFTELRPTTLHKGGVQPYRVYAATGRSRLLLDDQSHVTIITQKEWLCEYGCTDDIDDQPTPYTGSKVKVKVISYKGTVTGILDETLGVYELDGKVRLYTSLVPAVHKFSFLAQGARITAYNVHVTVNPRDSVTSLFCCMYSCIKSHTTADLCRKTVGMPPALQTQLYLHGVTATQLQWLYTSREALYSQLEHLANRRLVEAVCSTLMDSKELSWGRNISDPRRNILDEFLRPEHNCCLLQTSTTEDLPLYMSVRDILGQTQSSEQQQQQQQQQQRLPYWQSHIQDSPASQIVIGILVICSMTGHLRLQDTTGGIDVVVYSCHGDSEGYCHSNHCCDRVKPGTRLSCPLLNTCCVGKIVAVTKYKMCQERFQSVSNTDGNERKTGVRSHEVNYLMFSLDDVILMGNIRKRATAIVLGSEQGIVTPSDSEKPKVLKNIQGALEGYLEQSNIEPMLHDGHSVEDRDDKNQVVDCQDKGTSGTLHCHEHDAGGVYYCRQTSCTTGSGDKKSHSYRVKGVGQVQRRATGEVSNDRGQDSHVCDGNKSFKVDTDSRVCDVNKSASESSVNESRKFNSYVYLSEASGVVKPHVHSSKSKEQENTAPACLLENSTKTSCVMRVCLKEGIRLVECSANGVELGFCMLAQVWDDGKFGDECIYELKGPCIQWYATIHPGHLYRLTSPESSLLLNGRQTNTMVQKFVQRSTAKRCILVHPEVRFFTIFGDNIQTERYTVQKIEIKTILNERVADTFVSFDGVICGRSQAELDVSATKQNQERVNVLEDKLLQFGIATLDNRCVRLQVRSRRSTHEIQVYLNVESLSYPLGLLPGTQVEFIHVERRVSRVGNVYCRYVAASMVTVVGFSPAPITNRTMSTSMTSASTSSTSAAILPRLHLVDACRAPPRQNSFRCVSELQQVLKLSLKCVCSVCSSVLSQTRCSNTGCGSQAYRFVTRASVLVSDGTAVAMTTISGTAVQSMLRLTHDQWVCLETEVAASGEIFVQQTFPTYGSALEKCVYMLCDNRLIKTAWTMTLKHRYSPTDRDGGADVDKMEIDDFVRKTISTGTGEITTSCLPFLQLECVALDTVDVTKCVIHDLSTKSG